MGWGNRGGEDGSKNLIMFCSLPLQDDNEFTITSSCALTIGDTVRTLFAASLTSDLALRPANVRLEIVGFNPLSVESRTTCFNPEVLESMLPTLS